MGKLVRFSDSERACFSRVDWESGEPVFISIAQGSVLVKRSRLGFLGVLLYRENDLATSIRMSKTLEREILTAESLGRIPSGFSNPLLESMTRLALETTSSKHFQEKIIQTRAFLQTSGA